MADNYTLCELIQLSFPQTFVIDTYFRYISPLTKEIKEEQDTLRDAIKTREWAKIHLDFPLGNQCYYEFLVQYIENFIFNVMIRSHNYDQIMSKVMEIANVTEYALTAAGFEIIADNHVNFMVKSFDPEKLFDVNLYIYQRYGIVLH